MIPCIPQAFQAKKHAGVAEILHSLSAFPVLAPLVVTVSFTGHAYPSPFPNSNFAASNHHASPGKRQDWSKFGKVPFSCQTAANWCQIGQWRAQHTYVNA